MEEDLTPAPPPKGPKHERELLIACFQVLSCIFVVGDCAITLTFDFFVLEPMIFSNIVDGVRVLLLFFLLGAYYIIDWDFTFVCFICSFASLQAFFSWLASVLCLAGITVSKCSALGVAVSPVWSISFNITYNLIILSFLAYLIYYRREPKVPADPDVFLLYASRWLQISKFVYIAFLYELSRVIQGKVTTTLIFHTSIAFSASSITFFEITTKPSMDRAHLLLRLLSILFCALALSVSLVLYLIHTTGTLTPEIKSLDNIVVASNLVIIVHMVLYHRYHKGQKKSSLNHLHKSASAVFSGAITPISKPRRKSQHSVVQPEFPASPPLQEREAHDLGDAFFQLQVQEKRD